ncbi:MAG: DUF362 domain-containing protein [Pseudomonadota bacterium]
MPIKRCRREFLRTALITTGAAITGGPGLVFGPSGVQAQEVPDIAVAYGNDPAVNARAAVDALGGIKRFVKAGAKVVIKPNMSFARKPDEGANTNPHVVAEVAKMCVEAGAARIAVLDNVLHAPHDCLSLSGIPAACERIPNTTVQNVKARRLFKEAGVPKGVEVKKMEVIAEVLDADVLIAVPVGKSHSGAGVSLSMKGMMGLIHDRAIFHTRHNLHEAIVDMASLLKPHLIVIDGTRILSSGGPGGPGKVIPLNLVLASTDMVAADAQMVALGTWHERKFKPNQVQHIRIAAERGLGRLDLENLKVKKIEV